MPHSNNHNCSENNCFISWKWPKYDEPKYNFFNVTSTEIDSTSKREKRENRIECDNTDRRTTDCLNNQIFCYDTDFVLKVCNLKPGSKYSISITNERNSESSEPTIYTMKTS